MALDILFAIRGVLSFVAFTELTNAGRCVFYVEASYIQTGLFTGIHIDDLTVAKTLSRVYGLYCFLNGLIIIHTSIFAHYRPLVFLCATSLFLKLGFMLSEAFFFGSILTDKPEHLFFPFISCLVCLLLTLAIPYYTSDDHLVVDENSELLRKMQFSKKKKKKSD